MFDIRDYIQFNSSGRAQCPSCTLDNKPRNSNLALLRSGAYKCYRGCTPKEIRDALGAVPDQEISEETHKAQRQPVAKVYTEKQIDANTKTLLLGINPAKSWLINRGITEPMIEWARLGLVVQRIDKKRSKAIAIPYPTRTPGEFYLKKRVAPWDPTVQDLEKYIPWSQYGIPAMVHLFYNPEGATETWLCEGEWDAIKLGWMMKEAGETIAVACFSCGAGTVPTYKELERMPGDVKIWYDRNDAPTKTGRIPGDEGAKKVSKALKGRGAIALVPMPTGCDREGWDVSDAINAGYSRREFIAAAAAAITPIQGTGNPLLDRGRWNTDLIANAPDFTPFLVPDLLTENELFLLAAGPRAGKSLLAMSLAKAVAEGGVFLGRPVTQGNVIYVKCEDNDAKVKEREQRQGWVKESPVFWLDEFKLSELPHLEDLAERLSPRLIVLDTLSRIKTPGVSESSAEMSQLLEPLQVLAKTKECCILLVHHTSKVSVENANQIDIFDTIRGSSSIRAVCRGALVLAAGDRDYRLVCENGWGRHDLRVNLDPYTLTWKQLGKWGSDQDMPQKQQIIEALKKLRKATIKQLNAETGIHQNSLYKQISRLRVAEDAAERVIQEGVIRRYTYRLALVDTIGQLEMLSNSVNADEVIDSGDYWTKSTLSKSNPLPLPLAQPNGQNPLDHPPSPPTQGEPVHYQAGNPMPKPIDPNGQLVDTNGQPLKSDPRSAAALSQACDSNMDHRNTTKAVLDPDSNVLPHQEVVFAVGDTAEIGKGRFTGKQVSVLGFNKSGRVVVRAESWAINREYEPIDLRLISRAGDKASEQEPALPE